MTIKQVLAGPVKILLATNSRTTQVFIKMRLKSFAHVLTVVEDGAQVLTKAGEIRPDIFLLQSALQGIGGIELCRKISANPDTKLVPVVIFSTDEDIREEAKKAGARDFLKVPFEGDELIQVIQKCLKKQKVILLVDDSKLIHKAIGAILEANSYEVLHAEDGVEGLKMLEGRRPDLIISDIEMPNMNGYEFCSAVKNNPLTGGIPVLIQSSLSNGINIDKGFESGADDYITKPVVDQELLSRVRNFVDAGAIGGRETVLVVDDSNLIRNMIVQALSQQGFTTVTAANGQEAMERAKEDPPDLILTDNEMPVMDGIDFAREVRKLPDCGAIPIVMLSSRESKSDRVKGRIAGITEYLSKPFTADKLLVIIERLLAEFKLRREKDAMRLYMSDAAVEHATDMAKSGGSKKMRAKDAFMTILFTDIKGFTTMCESMTPQEVVTLLNDYFDVMVNILKSNDAVVDKFIGDAIMALFPRDDRGAYQAVKSGMEMMRALKDFNEKHSRELHMRCGINSGNVVMGDLGSKYHRRDFTVLGDNVNLAQRMESSAPVDGVLISNSTYLLVKDVVRVETPEPIKVKGKAEKIHCHIVKELIPVEF